MDESLQPQAAVRTVTEFTSWRTDWSVFRSLLGSSLAMAVFLLAYAAQGLPSDAGSGQSQQVRAELDRCGGALDGLAEFLARFVGQLNVPSKAPYESFFGVLARDARDAQAAVQLVLAQPSISSQVVDNLNASIHVRALLTDLFLIDEILKNLARQG